MFLGSPGKTFQVDFCHLGIILPGFHLPSQRVVEVLHILRHSSHSKEESSDTTGLLQRQEIPMFMHLNPTWYICKNKRSLPVRNPATDKL